MRISSGKLVHFWLSVSDDIIYKQLDSDTPITVMRDADIDDLNNLRRIIDEAGYIIMGVDGMSDFSIMANEVVE